MSDPFTNLQAQTGRTMPEWFAVLETTGLDKHTEIMNHLKSEHGVSHGFANGIALAYRSRGESSEDDDLVAAQYAGPKAALRPVYDALVAAAAALGDDVEIVPKKTGVSLRRSKQFAVIEAPSAKRIQLGLQLREHPVTDRLLPGNAMCSHKVNLETVAEVDDELKGWLREAYSRN
jgi:predicted transport protein